jgi:hypothetical protein
VKGPICPYGAVPITQQKFTVVEPVARSVKTLKLDDDTKLATERMVFLEKLVEVQSAKKFPVLFTLIIARKLIHILGLINLAHRITSSLF